MRCRIFNYALVFSICMLNWSCSILKPGSLKQDEDGYYVRHFNSCGPRALRKALEEFGVFLTEQEISRQIQDTGNGSRVLLSFVHHDTIRMTLPSEIKDFLKKHGYEITNIKDLEELNKQTDVAIILVAKNYLKGETHWLALPQDRGIIDYFGKGTKIVKIYLLKKTK